jgi:hypothetical protein
LEIAILRIDAVEVQNGGGMWRQDVEARCGGNAAKFECKVKVV